MKKYILQIAQWFISREIYCHFCHSVACCYRWQFLRHYHNKTDTSVTLGLLRNVGIGQWLNVKVVVVLVICHVMLESSQDCPVLSLNLPISLKVVEIWTPFQEYEKIA